MPIKVDPWTRKKSYKPRVRLTNKRETPMFRLQDYQNIDLHVTEHHLDQLLYGFVHYESKFCHFTETCGSYLAHDFYNFHNVCKDRVVYPYFMPIFILL